MKTYRDIAGDGGSRILEQVAEQKARIDRNLAGVRRRIAIGSGKGGVGKSTLTLQLGAALSLAGQRTAILDADLNGPSQARLAGLADVPLVPGERGLGLPRTPQGLGVVSLGSVVPESEALEFDSVATGDSHVWRATREFGLLGELLGSVEWGELDFLLVDLPPGAERTFQYAEYLGPQTDFVLVTIPSELARGVVARSVAALNKTPNRVLGVIENMCGYYCAGCDAVQPLFPEFERLELGVPTLGSVPFDPELSAVSDRGQPLPPDGPSARAIRKIAERLLEHPENAS